MKPAGIIPICFILIFSNLIYAGNSEPDSLLHILKTAKSDTAKVNICNRLFEVYEFTDTAKSREYLWIARSTGIKAGYKPGLANTYLNLGFLFEDKSDFRTAQKFQEKALKIFEDLSIKPENITVNEAKRGIAKCLKNIGVIHYYLGNYDTALVFVRRSFLLFDEIKDKQGSARVLMSTGIILTSQGNYLQSLTINLKALKIFEELGDKVYTYKCLMNVGVIHLYQKNYNLAIDYFNKTLAIAVDYNDRIVISNCHINTGAALTRLGKLHAAIDQYNKALHIREEIGDKAGIAAILMNIANNYYYSKDLKTALQFHDKSLKLRKEIGDKEGIATVYLNIAQIMEELKRYDEAVFYLQSSLKIAEESNSLELQKMCHENLSLTFEHKGEIKKSLAHHKSFKLMNDSIYNTESGKQLKEMEARYQNEKKQKEIDLKEFQLAKKDVEVRQQRTQKFAFIGGFILTLVLSLVIFKSYRDKKKANSLLAEQKRQIEEKNEELNQQNDEIRAQRDEIGMQRDIVFRQKEQIEEFHIELTDSIRYAEKIQKAVLPGEQYICDRLNREYFILYKPKNIVSGDFYFIEKRKRFILVAVADCTGHGVPGGFMSMLGFSFLQEIIAKDEIKAAGQVLDELRKYVIKSMQQKGDEKEQKDGIDMAFCAINTDTLEMQFAGANNPVWVVPSCHASTELSTGGMTIQLEELRPDKMPIGIHDRMGPFTNQSIQLHKGDMVYLASDGFEDQFGGPQRKKFLAKNLKNLLLANSQQPMASQKQILETTLAEWIGNNEQIDDITILGIQI